MLEKKSEWLEELPSVLWAYLTTILKAKGGTPFSMAYETKAIIPVQVTTMPNLHIEEQTALENVGILKTDLDVIEEP